MMTTEMAKMIISASRIPNEKMFYVLLGTTGQRPSAMLNLREGEIYKENQKIEVKNM